MQVAPHETRAGFGGTAGFGDGLRPDRCSCRVAVGERDDDGEGGEVLEINESEVRFRLDVDPWAIDDDIAGIYTVPLCAL